MAKTVSSGGEFLNMLTIGLFGCSGENQPENKCGRAAFSELLDHTDLTAGHPIREVVDFGRR